MLHFTKDTLHPTLDLALDTINIHQNSITTWNINSFEQGTVTCTSSPGTNVTFTGTVDDHGTFTLQNIRVESSDKSSEYKLTPMEEFNILAQVQQQPPENTHNQIKAKMDFLDAVYNDNPQNPQFNFPEVFFGKMDFDNCMASLSPTLEESILLFMEVNEFDLMDMSSDLITIPKRLEHQITNVRMNDTRNKLLVTTTQGKQIQFNQLTISVQVEICNEILSILPE